MRLNAAPAARTVTPPDGDCALGERRRHSRTRSRAQSTVRPRATIENDRRIYLTAMAKIKQDMILGADKNLYVEPAIWTVEWARDFYDYPVTRSN